ncbi:MAG: PSD1 domain-containing protein, partial [Planctomycetaceae bacterium]|nr:PSD1 domain-containing protein [Planctomycetaceae bacterium]
MTCIFRRRLSQCVVFTALTGSLLNSYAVSADIDYLREIKPILRSRCYSCHGALKQEGGLRLDTVGLMISGGESGTAIDRKHPEGSLLLQRLTAEDGERMPPEGDPLTPEIIDRIRQWLSADAAGPADESPQSDPKQHWSFQPLRQVQSSGNFPNPIDDFIAERLRSAGLSMSPPADAVTLVRRMYLDLHGLPPTPEQLRDWVQRLSDTHHGDASTGKSASGAAVPFTEIRESAVRELIDELLSSERYGERWAQHWLDVVRFAETEGFEYDRHLPEAWRFRDYVIDSLNSDKPFDQFVREQIAGDELRPNDVEYQTAAIFHRLGAVRRNAGNPEIALSRNEVLTERTNIIGEAFLGLTVGCARCHNHKLEPISQKDYYQLQAYLAATEEYNIPLAPPEEQEAWEKQAASINARIAALKKELATLSEEQKAEHQKKILAVATEQTPPPATIPSIRNEFQTRTDIHVLRRGVWEHKGVAVGPRPLSVLTPNSTPELSADIAAPRTELAAWLTDAEHPLTSRVIVNRIWQYHFGTGLVATANDFGTHGARPSHPELLDWLAKSLVDNGWRLKPLHRLIVLSNTYRQSTRPANDDVVTADPSNRLLSHFNRRRLSGEEIRDAMLAATGRLNRKVHGPSVITPVEPAMVELLY